MDKRLRSEVRGSNEEVRNANVGLSPLPSNLEPRTSISGPRRSSLALWSGILCGPIAFAINLQLRYALVSWACAQGSGTVLVWIAVPLVAMCIVGAFLSWTGFRIDSEGRARFMAYGGLILSALFALSILASMIPDFFLSPCD